MDRRGLLGSVLALSLAPAMVRAESLMRLSVPQLEFPSGIYNIGVSFYESGILHPENGFLCHRDESSALSSKNWTREQRQFVDRYCVSRNTVYHVQDRLSWWAERALERARAA